MTETATKKPVRRKRRGGRPRKEWFYYVVEITGWDWSFSFSVNTMKHFEGPYLDFRHVQLFGKLVRPSKANVTSVEVTLLPDARLDAGARGRHEPTMVGSVQLNRGRFQGLISIPTDVVGPILQMLIADRFRVVVMEGDKLRYGHAVIRSFRLDTRLEEDDLPSEG